MYINLELNVVVTINSNHDAHNRRHFGRMTFHTEDVDELYPYLTSNAGISNPITFENEPRDAPWGERYFHIREPDGYHLSFAKPMEKRKTL